MSADSFYRIEAADYWRQRRAVRPSGKSGTATGEALEVQRTAFLADLDA